MFPPAKVCDQQDNSDEGGYAGCGDIHPELDKHESDHQANVANNQYPKTQGYSLTLRNLHRSLSPVTVATMMERIHAYDTVSIGDQ
jgi:hypothetical protein